jgi:hypothetical protein
MFCPIGSIADAVNLWQLNGYVMKKIFLNLITILIALPAFSQLQKEWGITYQYDTGTYENNMAISVDAQNNIYQLIQANYYSQPNSSISLPVIRKLTAGGNVLFNTVYTRNNEKNANFKTMAVDSSGNVYVAGYRATGNSDSVYFWIVAKFNSNGTFAWEKEITDNGFESVAQKIVVSSTGEIYVAGYNIDLQYHGHGILIKMDTNGNEVWKRVTDCNSWQNVILENTSAGNIISGCSDSLVAFAGNGSPLWWSDSVLNYYYNGPVTAIDAQDNLYLLWWTGIGYQLRKIDAAGNDVWIKDSLALAQGFGDLKMQLITDDAGDIYAGSINQTWTNDTPYVYKISSQGNVLWRTLLDYDPSAIVEYNGKVFALGDATQWQAGSVGILTLNGTTGMVEGITIEGDSLTPRGSETMATDGFGNIITGTHTGYNNYDAVL